MNTLAYILFQVLVTLLIAPLIGGIIKKLKALSQKRVGFPILQMYYDIFKLFKKESVISETSSWVFTATPYIVLATSLAAAVLVPITTKFYAPSFTGDIILLFYLLALGRFFMCLSGLDTGSTFGGMGSSREAMISSLFEPTVLVCVFSAGLISGSTSIVNIMEKMNELQIPLLKPVFILSFFAMLMVILAEGSRIPVDDPATHLELTMVHEAMILEYSGRHLALMELGAAIKEMVLITLTINLFLPHDYLINIAGFGSIILSLLLFIAKLILVAVLLAISEISTVKFRFFSIPNLAALSFILAFLGFLQCFVLGR